MINIGTLHLIESLDKNLDDNLNGFYRDMKEYLNIYREDDFDWFGSPFTFKVAIGGDGAPFGKNDQSHAWLVSFLNVGKCFLSSEDNLLIFGGNCSESCTVVEKYISKLVSNMSYLENNIFIVKCEIWVFWNSK